MIEVGDVFIHKEAAYVIVVATRESETPGWWWYLVLSSTETDPFLGREVEMEHNFLEGHYQRWIL